MSKERLVRMNDLNTLYEIPGNMGQTGVLLQITDHKLGRGAISELIIGIHSEFGLVAVKKMHSHLRSGDKVDYFLQEARILQMLNHPNIIGYHSCIEHDGDYFIVMELADPNLYQDGKEMIRQKGVFSVDQAIDVAKSVGGAIDYAWERGILHRDIKPANILFSENNKPVKTIDYGLALVIGSQGTRLVERNYIVGTPAYMSPENAMGDELDPRSDLYSLGATLFHMLTGALPILGETPGSTIHRVIVEDPLTLTQALGDRSGLYGQYTGGLEAYFKWVMAKDPKDRPLSGGVMVNELKLIFS